MKTIITFSLFALISISATAQIRWVDISKDSIGTITASYTKEINAEIQDSTYFIHLSFQNIAAGKKPDIKSVYIKNKDEFDELVKDLNLAIQEAGTNAPINWSRDNYRLYKNDFNNELCFAEKPEKGNGYTHLNKTNAQKLFDWLGTIKFGKG